MAFAWTETNKQHLREMWGKGLTAGQIAAAIGNPSSNSVIGMAHRMGLAGRPSPIRKRGPADPTRAAAAKRGAQERREAREREIAERARRAEQEAAQRREDERKRRERQIARAEASGRRCAFPMGDPKAPDFRCCNEPCKPNSPYCDEHHTLTHIRKEAA